MTLLPKSTKENAEKSLAELDGSKSYDIEEYQRSILHMLDEQQKRIAVLLEHNDELLKMVQKYKHTQDSSEIIMQRIWDNEKDEFWDTL